MNTNRKSTNFLSALVSLLTFLVFYTLADSAKAQSNTPLIEVKHGNIEIKNNQAIPINYGHGGSQNNRTESFTIKNISPNDIIIEKIVLKGSSDYKVLDATTWVNKKILKDKSETLKIDFERDDDGIRSAIVSISYKEASSNIMAFDFPITGKTGNMNASLYRTDLIGNGKDLPFTYIISRSFMNGNNSKTYHRMTSFGNSQAQLSHTSTLAIDTVNNLIFWTKISDYMGGYYVRIMRGLMDNRSIVGVTEIYKNEEISVPQNFHAMGMGLAINPKNKLVYFSFSVKGAESGPIQRIDYDGKNLNHPTNAKTSSHLALDKNGNLFAIENNKIYRYNKNFVKKLFYHHEDEGPVTISGISIDTYNNELYYVYRNRLFKLPIIAGGNAGTRIQLTDNNKNLENAQVSSIAYSGKKNNDRNHEKVYYTYYTDPQTLEYRIDAWNIKNKEIDEIIGEGKIKMPSGGRLAIFPSMKVPPPEIAVYTKEVKPDNEIEQGGTINLGKIKKDQDIQEHNIFVENIGSSNLSINDITTTNDEIELDKTSVTDLEVGGRFKFSLKLTRKTVKKHSGTITIKSDAGNYPEFTFNIEWEITEETQPDIKVVIGDKQASPTLKQDSLIDLGSTPLKVNKPKTFGIYNPLSNPIDVEDITSSVPAIFKVKSKPKSIGSKKLGTFEIELVASRLGKHEGVISLFSQSFQKGEFKFKVKGEVTEDKTLKIYNVVTPNDDNIHDFFEIVNITAYPNNKVTIFNRWGDVVYEATGYDNNKKKFVGIANKHGNEKLISGNYYYAIDLGDGSKLLTGFLFLKIDF